MSNTDYLDLAKSITDSLYNLCTEKEYNVGTVVAGISIGTYMFLKHIANLVEDVTPADLYKEFDSWVKWVDSVNNHEVQEQESISRCEN